MRFLVEALATKDVRSSVARMGGEEPWDVPFAWPFTPFVAIAASCRFDLGKLLLLKCPGSECYGISSSAAHADISAAGLSVDATEAERNDSIFAM